MLDLALAGAHHLLIFGLFAILIAEFLTVRPGMSLGTLRSLAQVDLAYGAIAAAIVIVGFSRAIFAAKGWDYYAHNLFFWLKIFDFVLIAALSVFPTLAFVRWRGTAAVPTGASVLRVRKFLWAELLLFALLPLFAAAMARGYGALD